VYETCYTKHSDAKQVCPIPARGTSAGHIDHLEVCLLEVLALGTGVGIVGLIVIILIVILILRIL